MSKSDKKIITIDAKKWLTQITMPITEYDGEEYYELILPSIEHIALSPFVKAYEKRDENAIFDQMEYCLDEYYGTLDRHPGDPDQPIIFLDFDNCFDRIPRVSTATYKGKTVIDYGQSDEDIKDEINSLRDIEEEENKKKKEALAVADNDKEFREFYKRVMEYNRIMVLDPDFPWISDIVDYEYIEDEEEPIPIYGEERPNIVDYRGLSEIERTNIEYNKAQIYEEYKKAVADLKEDVEAKGLKNPEVGNAYESLVERIVFKYYQSSPLLANEDLDDKKSENRLLERLKELFSHGFVMTIDDPVAYYYGYYSAVYLPFDKSASMARQNKMSFIDKSYIQEMNERLMVGIDFGKMSVPLSKFYAYKGLYFSTSRRINPKAFEVEPETVNRTSEAVEGEPEALKSTSEALGLNEKTVIVIDDDIFDLRKKEDKNYYAYIAKPCNSEDKLGENVQNENKEKITRTNEKFEFHFVEKDDPDPKLDENDRFDGEGLISFEYKAILVKELEVSDRVASFQIRLPFAKGMLHSVDFRGFLKEFAALTDDGRYEIKDAFGITRDLMQAEIILTKSMFKLYGWLKSWVDQYKNSLGKLGEDPMAYYFNMLKEYNHSLYICRDDLSFQNGNLTTCNYQFLNTLHLNKEEYRALFELHKEYIQNPQSYIGNIEEVSSLDEENNDPNEALEKSSSQEMELEQLEQSDLEMVDNSESDTDEEDNTVGNIDNGESDRTSEDRPDHVDENEQKNGEKKFGPSKDEWIGLLRKNSDQIFKNRLLKDPYVRNQLIKMSYGRMKDIGFGKLLLPGEVRFLSRDLLCFLYSLLELGEENYKCKNNSSNNDSDNEQKKYKKLKQKIKAEFLEESQFDMPGDNIRLSSEDYYPIFRNPHLSRCEQVCLKFAKRENIRRKYLGHLRGTLMVSMNSFAPIILGGADFDGDIVKIFNQDIIRDSVLKKVYGMEGEYKTGAQYLRVLPIVTNYSADKSMVKNASIGLYPDFEVLHNTFSNNIGVLSNLSSVVGAYEYGNDSKGTMFDMVCEKLNILVGIDIDAAKSGQRADLRPIKNEINCALNDQFNKSLYKARKESFVGGFVKELRKQQKAVGFFNPDQMKKEGFVEDYSLDNAGVGESLEYIPFLFKEGLSIKPDLSNNNELQYAFLDSSKNWKNEFENELKNELGEEEYSVLSERLNVIIKAYKDVFKWARKANRRYKSLLKTNYISPAVIILTKQGIPYTDAVTLVNSLALELYSKVDMRQAEVEEEEFDQMLSRLKQSDWIYLHEDSEKLAVFKEIIGIEDESDFFSYIFNFSNKGFLLLFLLLKLAKRIAVEQHKSGFLRSYLENNFESYKKISENDKTEKNEELERNKETEGINKTEENEEYKAIIKNSVEFLLEQLNTSVSKGCLVPTGAIDSLVDEMREKILAEIDSIDSHKQFMLVYRLLKENELLEEGYIWEIFDKELIKKEIAGSELEIAKA